ncbi:MAG: glycogen synthase, partial [Verrucomicrobiota bacterium]
GTGFLFEDATPNALYDTIGWACATYYDRREEFDQLRMNAMSKDFRWDVSAKTYEDVYGWAIEARSAAFGDKH